MPTVVKTRFILFSFAKCPDLLIFKISGPSWTCFGKFDYASCDDSAIPPWAFLGYFSRRTTWSYLLHMFWINLTSHFTKHELRTWSKMLRFCIPRFHKNDSKSCLASVESHWFNVCYSKSAHFWDEKRDCLNFGDFDEG